MRLRTEVLIDTKHNESHGRKRQRPCTQKRKRERERDRKLREKD